MGKTPQEAKAVGGFWHDFRRFFFRGLAAVLPPLLTIMILVYVFNFVQNKLGKHIDTAVKWVVVQYIGLSQGLAFDLTGRDEIWAKVQKFWGDYHLSWIGIILALVLIYILGRFLASYVGRALWRMVERALGRTPVVRQIYPSVKQVTDFLLREPAISFGHVVAVEYPRKGIWSLGFVTGSGMRRLEDRLGSDLLTVFVPSSPTPVTGYTITVRREEVVDLPLTMDEALRFTVSGGVLTPLQQRTDSELKREKDLAGLGAEKATMKQGRDEA
ncbi:MAG TPA: DUF502 domain-containing protein [Phycisphaerae bacterium]|nr:DUF502 domain-containing protein [Phycisphaerae bacterium]